MKNKKTKIHILLLIILFSGTFIMGTVLNANNDFTNYKKPWFTIEFETRPMGIDIRLNDIPITNIDDTGFMTLEVPVNEYIINGDNEIQITTHPLFDNNDKQMDDYVKDTSIKVSLYVREDDKPSDTRTLINRITIHPEQAYLESNTEPVAVLENMEGDSHTLHTVIKDGTILNYPEYGNFKKQVVTKWDIKNINTNLPRWAWQDGVIIENNKTNYNSLLKAYGKLHDAYKNKDTVSIKKIAKHRSKELSEAYYLDDAEAGYKYSAMGKDINSESVVLHPELYMSYMKFDILANGKLARIMNGGHTHPIVFVNYETEQVYDYQFMWYLNKNNEWILIR